MVDKNALLDMEQLVIAEYCENKGIDEENIGPGGWLNEPYYIWHVRAIFGNTFFMFEHEKDATAFSTRWR